MQRIKGLALLTVFLGLYAASGALLAQSETGAQARVFGLGQPQSIQDLPAGQLKDRLESLPAQASIKALLWLQDFSFPEADLATIHADDEGNILYGDTLLPDPEGTAEAGAAGPTLPSEAPASTLDDAFALHSRPGAPNVVFIDFDGDIISGTAWNGSVSTYYARPYDLDGDPATFNTTERTRIVDIWHRVAEDYAPFDIDVTTEEPASFDRYTGHILVTHSIDDTGTPMPYDYAGGVAYVNVFGNSIYHTYYSPALVYYNHLGSGGETYVAEASSHEFGHNTGLSHDGTNSGTTYYAGHGSGLVSWAPIMGNSYYNNVTEFSKGEYPDANQKQDDLAIIAGKLSYRPDDHGDTPGTATPLAVDPDGSVIASNPELDPHNVLTGNKGVIGDADDVDVFSFVAGAGTVSLTLTPAWDAFYRSTSRRGANLDIEAELRDPGGATLALNDPENNTGAAVSASVAGGTYYLFVTGIGNAVTPYSDYDSLGQYFINGSVPVASADTSPPNPNPMTWASAPAALSDSEITMTANTATDDVSAVEYRFECTVGGAGCSNSGWQSSTAYTASGLAPGTSYTWQVTARDQSLNETAPSAPASASTDEPPPPPPPPAFVDHLASGETPVAGTVSGSYTDTRTDDGASQAVTEQESGGRKSSRHSYLEHRWNFTIGAGVTVTVYANAWSGGSGDGDTFDFEYSLDGGSSFYPLFNVSSTGSGNTQSAGLPGTSSGPVVIRVVDTDRSTGATELDTVYVDQLYIRVDNPSSDPPGGDPPTLSLSASGYKDKGQHHVVLEWTGSNGVDVYRDGVLIAPGIAGSSLDDDIGAKGGATYLHQVCEAGTANCSNTTTTVF